MTTRQIVVVNDQLVAPYEGIAYRLADNWLNFIPKEPYRALRYAEIGTFYGANLISVAQTYGTHPESRLVAIDPWIDYSEYPEYKDQQDGVYATFLNNIVASGLTNKIEIRRGFSHEVVPQLKDDAYDIIYVDGNHEPEYALEDAVLAFRKLRVGGYLVFDDYGWGGPDLTQRGIDAFISGYYKRIEVLGEKKSQVFVRKIK